MRSFSEGHCNSSKCHWPCTVQWDINLKEKMDITEIFKSKLAIQTLPAQTVCISSYNPLGNHHKFMVVHVFLRQRAGRIPLLLHIAKNRDDYIIKF